MNLSLLPIAQQELDEAVQWYEAQSPGLGARFLAEGLHAFGVIQQFPTAWHPLSANTRRLKRFPYGVIYATETNEIIVIALAHLHRKPAYWSTRLN